MIFVKCMGSKDPLLGYIIKSLHNLFINDYVTFSAQIIRGHITL